MKNRILGFLGALVALYGLAVVAIVVTHKPRLDTALGEDSPPSESAAIEHLLALAETSPAPAEKIYGCLKARVEIPKTLPPQLKQGIFATPAAYTAWLQFKALAPRNTADADGNLYGVSMKLTGLKAKTIEGVTTSTLDLTFQSHPTLAYGDAADWAAYRTAEAKGSMWSYYVPNLNPFSWRLSERSIHRASKQRLGNLVEATYYSATPYKLNDSEVKYVLKPCFPPTNEFAPKNEKDYLRGALEAYAGSRDTCFELHAQPRNDTHAMPLENATVEWTAPTVLVAKVIIPKQFFTPRTQVAFCETLTFETDRTLASMRPLGGVNRARRAVEEKLRELRKKQGIPEGHEPSGKETFGD